MKTAYVTKDRKNVVAPVGGFSSFDGASSKDLPLDASSIRDLFFSGDINLKEAVHLLNQWRYFPIRSCLKETDLHNGKVRYVYGVVSKRGNTVSCKKIKKHKYIAPLLKICEKYDHDLPLIFNGKTRFLKMTLTPWAKKVSRNEWNSRRCADEVVLFKKRLRSFYGSDLRFARTDEAHKSGYIHVNLIVFSPSHKFDVFLHKSRKKLDINGNPVCTWRLGSSWSDRKEKDFINSLWVTDEKKRFNVDIKGLRDCHDLIEYALKYQIKFFKNFNHAYMREFTLGVLTLFNKRSIAISKQFCEDVVEYIEAKAVDLDVFKRKCPEKKLPDNKRYEFLTLISDYTLNKYGFDTSKSYFASDRSPPNIPVVSERKDFSRFPKLGSRFFVSDIGDKFILADSKELLEVMVEKCLNSEFVAVDTETTGINAYAESLVGVSLACDDGSCFYVPLGHDIGNVGFDVAVPLLNKILSSKVVKFFHNFKFDLAVLNRFGMKVSDPVFDTMVAVHSYDSSKTMMSLDSLALELFDYEMVPITDYIGKDERLFAEVSVDDACFYACEDACLTYLVGKTLFYMIEESVVKPSFVIDMKLIPAIISMESAGVCVDIERAKVLSDRYGHNIEKVVRAIYDVVGYEFNVNSDKIVRRILYNELGLPIKERTEKLTPKVDKYALSRLAEYVDLADLIIEYRRLVKLKNSFIDKLVNVASKDGFIFSNFNMTATSTGRFSSSNPNMQQIPKNSTSDVRSLIVSRSNDFVLMRADYSNIELRMIAHLSKDPLMVSVFRNELDLHSITTSKIFNKSIEKISHFERSIGKTVNFSLLYGCGAKALARKINFDVEGSCVSVSEASLFKKSFFDTYEGIVPYFDNVIEKARHDRCICTSTGSRRWFPNLEFLVGFEVEGDRRKVKNFVVQGACADLLKKAMLLIHDEFVSHEFRSKMILTVHDELVFDVCKYEMVDVEKVVRSCMESAVSLCVPVEVDLSFRRNWAENIVYQK